MIARGVVVGVALVLAGCAADGPLCPADEVRRDATTEPLCVSAWELARRTTTAVTPTPDEIYDALALVAPSGPLLRARIGYLPTAGWRWGVPTTVEGVVTDPVIALRWRAGLIETGDPEVDAVLVALDAIRVTVDPSGTFSIETRRAVALPNVKRALDRPGLTVEIAERPPHALSSDIEDEGIDPADGGHVLVFQVGGGDCPLGCTTLHWWRTKLRPDGHAILVEDWGDPWGKPR